MRSPPTGVAADAAPRRLGAMLESAATPFLAMPLGLVRNVVSGSKVRYTSGGYDLDLTYITDRIIAMGLPATSIEQAWRNSISEVVRFLHDRHPGVHRVYNLCDEREYDGAHFHSALHLPFPDHHPPSMDALLLFVADARAWLIADARNVVAVHCKAGKGRTGVMIGALLLALRHPGCSSARDALAFFRAARTRDGDACRNAGQIRYVHYYEAVLAHGAPPARALRLLRLELRRTDGGGSGAARTARGGGGGASARFGRHAAATAAAPFLHAVRSSMDGVNGADAANPLTVASGATVTLKVACASASREPLVLEPAWRAASEDERVAPHGPSRALGGPAESRTLAQLSAWLATDARSVVLSAPLGGLEVSADVKMTMGAVGGLAVARVHERLWRLNFHTAYEALHRDGGHRGEAAESDARTQDCSPGGAAGAGAAAAPWRSTAPSASAGAPATTDLDGAPPYLLFTRDGLDDCRGFANSYDFELRIYVQPLP
ncbi:hypothetical protein KFE25_014276 [Diacronema lutheri]|uniref:Phosphatidylinositol-3,4,5-trisphosphate 3-phosphatase n=1 Tax=Diacronema lutheri TaxID=2081491 RepID=A0A8J6C6I0_DIALT|nr:hypothetical protein KFE25_014276 [Diacronema lutheri]